MKKVQILLSSYNGSGCIEKQIASILSQRNIEVHLLIRDDGSTDGTRLILQKYENKFAPFIAILYGENIGWKKSFFELLKHAGEFDYYGFSDQDDLWFDDKIDTCIKELESRNYNVIPALAQTGSWIASEDLTICKEQKRMYPLPVSYKQLIAQEYFQGCSMVWNYSAMELIRLYFPKNEKLAHDYWLGVVCSLFGKTIFIEKKKMYHIRYLKNASQDGNVKAGRRNRIKMFLNGESNVYYNPSMDLLNGYKDYLSLEQKVFFERICNPHKKLKERIKLIFDKEFIRESWLSTMWFKFLILIDKY